MKLVRVEIENWGAYKGKHEIELDVPDRSPLVIIYGENATGKTTFANAIRWAFYGGNVDRGGFDPAVYTSIYVDSPFNVFELSIALFIETRDHRYEVRRRATANRDGRTNYGFRISDEVAELVIDDDPTPTAVVETGIRRLLPSDLSDFFLFDGEELQRIDRALTGRQQTSVVKDRISDLLGLPVLEEFLAIITREDEFVLRRIRTDENVAKSNERYQEQLDEVNARFNVLVEESRRLKGQMEEEQDRLERIRKSMSNSHDLKVVANRLKGIEDELEDQEAALAEVIDDLANSHEEYWYLPVADMLLKKGELQETSAEAKSEADRERWEIVRRLEAMQGLTDLGVCPTCGQACAGREEEWKEEAAKLSARLSEIPDAGQFLHFDRLLSTWCQDVLVGVEVCLRDSEKFGQLNLSVSRLQSEKRRLEGSMRGQSSLDIQALVTEYDDVQGLIGEIDDLIRENRDEIAKVDGERDSISKKIVNSAGVDPKHRARHDILEQLKSVVSESVEAFRERIRKDVEESASEFYLQMETDPFVVGLSISKDYELRILSGNKDDPTMRAHGSAGQTLSSVYALIGALIRVSGNPCFWLVDTPVSRADTKRTPAIWRWLANQNRQVIVLPHSGELTSTEARSLFGERLGRELEIVRTNEDLTSTIRQYRRSS